MKISDGPRFSVSLQAQRLYVLCKLCGEVEKHFIGNTSYYQAKDISKKFLARHRRRCLGA